MKTYSKFPYRTEFSDSLESARNSQTLEDALHWARWTIHSRWSDTNEYGRAGEYAHDAETAVVTNRNTGYRWILRRGDQRVEFQTPEMLEESVAGQTVELHLTIEEVEALARAAAGNRVKDNRQNALVDQTLDQIALICRQVRDRVRAADDFIDAWTRSIPVRKPREQSDSEADRRVDRVARSRLPTRPLGDPDNLSLKEAGEILGKARNTIYLWYRQGKFPPAIDVAPYLGGAKKPVIVVPRYRLEAWQAGERMPEILQAVFEIHALHEAPWACWTPRKGANNEDVAFWVDRRGWKRALGKNGHRIYESELDESKTYEVRGLI